MGAPEEFTTYYGLTENHGQEADHPAAMLAGILKTKKDQKAVPGYEHKVSGMLPG